MSLAPRLDLRQSQTLVMTPQLQQAIKLLALSNLEIEGFIAEEIERNPLLEAGAADDAARLRDGRLDALITIVKPAPDGLTAEPLIDDPLVIAGRAGHPLGGPAGTGEDPAPDRVDALGLGLVQHLEAGRQGGQGDPQVVADLGGDVAVRRDLHRRDRR